LEVARQVLAALAVFLFPGYALLIALRRYRRAGAVEVLCVAAGLSIAVVPLLLYACTLLGWRLSPTMAGAVTLVLGGVFVADTIRRATIWWPRRSRQVNPYHLGLSVVFLMTLIARLWMVRGINYPLWTDSYHHTLIAELIARLGMVPSTYEPFAPIPAFTYHFGFHTLVAWFHWLSGVPIPRSVVLVGQVLNALVVPTTYLFTWRLMNNQRAALVAATILGLLSFMPARFVNWGRYPQLAGQILLPVLIVLTIDAFESRRLSFGRCFVAGVAAAGLFLVHNRITLFYAALAFLLFAVYAVKARRHAHQFGRVLLSAFLILAVAVLIDLAWLARFFDGFGGAVAQQAIRGYQPAAAGSYFAFTLQDLFHNGMHPVWLVIAGLSAAWGLLKRDRGVWLLVGWILLLFGAANIHLIRMVPLFSSLIVAIFLYLPVAILVGYGVDRVAAGVARRLAFLSPRTRTVGTLALAAVLVVAGLGGMAYTSKIIEPDNGFVRPADLAAMEWISQNTPADARFHIATHFWTPVVAHGLDAGYWIPYLTGRETTIPPEVYGSDGSASYIDATNQRLRELAQATTASQLWQVLQQFHVTHIYIGNRPTDLRPDLFDSDPAHFRLLYARDHVWVYEVVQSGE
jgi:hypothetical protein